MVCERLEEENNIPRETPIYVLTNITRCNVTAFVGPFALLLNTERAKHMNTTLSMTNKIQVTSTRVREITLMANSYFHFLNILDGWNVPYRHWMGSCYNCNSEDHTTLQCPHPCDKSRIESANKARNTGRGKGK